MKNSKVFGLYKMLEDDKMCLIYQGDFSDEITGKMVALSDTNIDNFGELNKLKRKVSNIMVECFQNIVRHGEKPSMIHKITNRTGIFITRNFGDSFYIVSVNLVDNDQVEMLKKSLEDLNHMDKDELKELYLEMLATGKISEKGGAGLGLIDMARRASHQFDFEFQKVNEQLTFFYLQIQILGKGTLPNASYHSIEEVEQLHREMILDNILMVYKGDFSKDSIMPVLQMVEDNLVVQLEEYNVKKKVYGALIEMMQNISKHSKKTDDILDGIIVVNKKDRKYMIHSGNLLDIAQVHVLKEKLDHISGLDEAALNAEYNVALEQERLEDDEISDVGLMFLALKSQNQIEYSFHPIDDDTLFCSLSVKI